MGTKKYDKHLDHWKVDLYEQTETEVDDVQMIKKLLGSKKTNVSLRWPVAVAVSSYH